MRVRSRMPWLGALLAAALMSSGCSLIVGNQVDDLMIDPNSRRDLNVGLRVFTPHVGQLITLDAVNPNNLIVAQARIDAAPSDCLDISMQNAIPVDTAILDFSADLNRNGQLDPPPADHSWREELVDGALTFVHSTDFTDLTEAPPNPAALPFLFRMADADDVEGQPADVVYVNVTNDAAGNVVEEEIGLIHVAGVVDGRLEARLESVVDAGTEYIVEVSFGEGDMRTRCVTLQRTATITDQLTVDVSFPDPDIGCEVVPVEETRQAFEDCSIRP